MAGYSAARAFADFAAVHAGLAVDTGYVPAAVTKWGRHVAAQFRMQATSLGFDRLEGDKMRSKLAQICVVCGRNPRHPHRRGISPRARSVLGRGHCHAPSAVIDDGLIMPRRCRFGDRVFGAQATSCSFRSEMSTSSVNQHNCPSIAL